MNETVSKSLFTYTIVTLSFLLVIMAFGDFYFLPSVPALATALHAPRKIAEICVAMMLSGAVISQITAGHFWVLFSGLSLRQCQLENQHHEY